MNYFSAESNENHRNALVNAISGACAGALAKTVVAPIERVKLLMQLRGSIDKSNNKISALRVAIEVYHAQGILAFWRGKRMKLW